MVYLTFTNEYSGVYQSQVIDVCRYVEESLGPRCVVVSLVSVRAYRRERRRLRGACSRSVILPMVPGVRNWRWNVLLLLPVLLWCRSDVVIGRSEFATNLGLMLRRMGRVRRVVFDGRSARAAEAEEYDVGGRPVFAPSEIRVLEEKAVLESDYRIAVSTDLVGYWTREYGYTGTDHAVIPCTVGERTPAVDSVPTRQELGLDEEQTVLVYAGSSAQWQSFEVLDQFAAEALQTWSDAALLLLSDCDVERLECARRFPDRVINKWVPPSEVLDYLALADYGLLLREPSTTNRVACPTKFGEYLQAGLQVVITNGVGDLSTFVREKKCGVVLDSVRSAPRLARVDAVTRRRNTDLARQYFDKKAYREAYAAALLGPEAPRVSRSRSDGERP